MPPSAVPSLSFLPPETSGASLQPLLVPIDGEGADEADERCLVGRADARPPYLCQLDADRAFHPGTLDPRSS